ncbi:MAG: PAS domain S-box protein [Promethearchaeota archaeon]
MIKPEKSIRSTQKDKVYYPASNRELTEFLPDIIFEADLNLKLVYANSIAFKKFGYTQDEFENGIYISQLLAPQCKEQAFLNLNKVLKGKITKPNKYILIKKDKSSFHARVHSRPVFSNGKVVGIRGVIHDISEMVEAEQKLRESEEKYRYLFENSPFPIFLIDTKGIVLDCNPSFEEMTGYKKEEVMGIKYADLNLIHPKYISTLLNRLKMIKKVKKHPSLEIEIFRKDGSILWIRIQSSLVEIGNNAFIQVIGDDITPQKEAEKKLRESEEKYRSLIKASPNLIFLFDDDGTVIDCNKSAELSLKRSREKIINKKIYDFLTNLTKEMTFAIFDKFKDNLKKDIYDPIEFSYTSSKGQVTWYQLYYSLVTIGENSYFHLELQDFTKLKEAEYIIREENRRLLELDKLRKKFLDIAAHELKTPLTSVYGAIQLLYELNKDSFNLESLKFTEIAKNGCERLKNLILNLLDISRLESNNFKIYKENQDLVKIIKSCISDISYLFYKRRHIVTLDIPEELYVEVDKSGIERVIINLLSNAINYTPPEGKIEVKVRERGNNLELSVKDTGIGLTKEEIKRIFDKFSKIERSKDETIELIKEGTGLGLNISKEIIELHGGQILVSSEGRNKGSIFIVRLPLNKT